MPLDAHTLATPATQTNYPRLAPKAWLDKVVAYRDAVKGQHEAEQVGRSLKARADVLKAELDKTCGGVPIAFCGQHVLTFGDTAAAEATITLATGEKVPVAQLRGFVLPDGRVVKPADVAKVYSGRDGSRKLVVTP